jgi:hypothetical protein
LYEVPATSPAPVDTNVIELPTDDATPVRLPINVFAVTSPVTLMLLSMASNVAVDCKLTFAAPV